jgi:signal peptidase II
MTCRRWGFALAAVTLLVDQANKAVMLHVVNIGERPPIRVAPFFELTLVWNRGISYGLFQQHEDWGRYGLVVLSVAAAIGLSVWLWRSATWPICLALGLLIGGALGNAIDRLVHGAVADFVLLYWIPWFPYVFNIGDSAIVAGVALLLYDSLVVEGRRPVKNRVDVNSADPGDNL